MNNEEVVKVIYEFIRTSISVLDLGKFILKGKRKRPLARAYSGPKSLIYIKDNDLNSHPKMGFFECL